MVRNLVVLLTANTPWRLTNNIKLGNGDIWRTVREVEPVTQRSIDALLDKNDSLPSHYSVTQSCTFCWSVHRNWCLLHQILTPSTFSNTTETPAYPKSTSTSTSYTVNSPNSAAKMAEWVQNLLTIPAEQLVEDEKSVSIFSEFFFPFLIDAEL